jgi:hypothetical protein
MQRPWAPCQRAASFLHPFYGRPRAFLCGLSGISYVDARATASLNDNSMSTSSDYGVAKVGAGFIVNRRLTLQPSVSIPFGEDGAKSSFTLAFAYTFGSSAKR